MLYITLTVIVLVLLGASAVRADSGFGIATSGPVHLDDVDCQGDEYRLLECPQVPVGGGDCTHVDDAGVRCRAERKLD